jgi:hypothetical protein
VKPLGIGAITTAVAVCCVMFGGQRPIAALAQRNIGTAVVAQATTTPAATAPASPSMTAAPATPATTAPAAPAPPPADFGSPPSGEIPILYNDHHVYSRPDTLRHDRVLAALVHHNTVLIPLRSMFEQMGATVSWNAADKTVTVSKPGAQVQVTVGKPEVVINGETRPLDVPPMLYRGTVLVPVRVISEGMGAYVDWVQDRHIVVVRYLPPTPPPPPPAPPTAAPPPPTPTPVPAMHEVYIAGDYIFRPKIYNEFSPGNTGTKVNYAVRGAAEFSAGNIPFYIAGDWRHWQYPHDCAGAGDPECFVTNIGGIGNSFVPAFTADESDVDARLGVRVLQPRMYLALSYLWRHNNYGYPNMNGWGFGGEKLPDLDHPFSVYGSIFYYPNVYGDYVTSNGFSYKLEYRVLRYQIGVDYSIQNTPLFIEAGWIGDQGRTASANDPAGYSHNGPYAGLGLKFIY